MSYTQWPDLNDELFRPFTGPVSHKYMCICMRVYIYIYIYIYMCVSCVYAHLTTFCINMCCEKKNQYHVFKCVFCQITLTRVFCRELLENLYWIYRKHIGDIWETYGVLQETYRSPIGNLQGPIGNLQESYRKPIREPIGNIQVTYIK